jgi:hypothetical protein
MHDPVSAHIHLKIKEKTWRGGVAREMAIKGKGILETHAQY